MLNDLISKYGKDKLNTLTKYPSILTLHKIGNNKLLTYELTTPIPNEKLYATEKIDGTNIRLLFYGNERIVGTRENLFVYHQSDFNNLPKEFFSSVEFIKPFYEKSKWNTRIETDKLTVVYGELYGSNIGKNGNNYSFHKQGYRVFNVAVYDDLSILDSDINKISKWRERETDNGIVYGQKFLTRLEVQKKFPQFEIVPEVEFDLGDMSHMRILKNLNRYISNTKVALSEDAMMKPEGIVLANESRTFIVKIRYEDYEKTLKI